MVYKRTEFCCSICGSKNNLTCDHFIPKWTRIVGNDADNLIPICKECNEAKGLQFLELAKLKYLPRLWVELLMRFYSKNRMYLRKYVRDFGYYRTNGMLDVEHAMLVLDSYDSFLEENKESLQWEDLQRKE